MPAKRRPVSPRELDPSGKTKKIRGIVCAHCGGRNTTTEHWVDHLGIVRRGPTVCKVCGISSWAAGHALGTARSNAPPIIEWARGWKLEWSTAQPRTIYVSDEKGGSWSDSALRYDDGRIAYDFPERVPQYVKTKVRAMFTRLHAMMSPQ